jgi:hypothetical protein
VIDDRLPFWSYWRVSVSVPSGRILDVNSPSRSKLLDVCVRVLKRDGVAVGVVAIDRGFGVGVRAVRLDHARQLVSCVVGVLHLVAGLVVTETRLPGPSYALIFVVPSG